MAPLIALLVQTLLPIAVDEAKKKIEAGAVKPAAPDPHMVAVTDTFSGAIKSKTIWFAVIVAVLGFVEQNQGLLTQYIGSDKMGIVIMVVGLIGAALRTVTTGSLGDKVPSQSDTPQL